MMLKHLVIHPTGGLGNQFRAIASAKRLCAMNHARCTVFWRRVGYDRLVAPDSTAEWISSLPDEWSRSYHVVKMLLSFEGGTPCNRRVSLTEHENLIVKSCHIFNAYEESG